MATPLSRPRRGGRLNLRDLAVEAGRAASPADAVVEAVERFRQRLSREHPDWAQRLGAHRDDVRRLAEEHFAHEALTESERRAITVTVRDLFGWGQLQPYLDDPAVTEILVDDFRHVDVMRRGRLERTDVRWRTHEELLAYIKRLIEPANRPLDAGNPIVSCEIGGHRVHATCPPVSKSCTLNIRKATTQTRRFSPQEYCAAGGCDPATMRLLLALARAGATMLICGPMNSGKTTIARILIESGARPAVRWIVCEDTRETEAQVPRFVSLQTVEREHKPVTMDDLMRAVKRMSPDRVAIGEVRSHREANALLQSIQSGHPGAITTTHAGTPAQAINNFVFYLKAGGMDIREDFLREVLHEALDILVFVALFPDGGRRITRVVEVVPLGDPEHPDGFRDLVRWDVATGAWRWVQPLSPALAERFAIQQVVVPHPDDPVTLADLEPAALDAPGAPPADPALAAPAAEDPA